MAGSEKPGGGLEFVEKSGRRYFFEQDVIEYLWGRSMLSVSQVLSYAVFMQYGILFKVLQAVESSFL